MNFWFDAESRIARVDEEWAPFAAANGAPGLTAEAVQGLPLAGFIGDPTTRHLWELLLQRARKGKPLRLAFRCDASDRRRWLAVEIARDGEWVRVQSVVDAETLRPAILSFEDPPSASQAKLNCCSWCNRFEASPGRWLEVEELLQESRLFEAASLPPVSHGICSDCLAGVEATIAIELAIE